jgi:hypothetical protein
VYIIHKKINFYVIRIGTLLYRWYIIVPVPYKGLSQTPNVGTAVLCSWLYQNFAGSRRPVHVILHNQLPLYALPCQVLLLLRCWPELDHCRFSGRSLDGCHLVWYFCEKNAYCVCKPSCALCTACNTLSDRWHLHPLTAVRRSPVSWLFTFYSHCQRCACWQYLGYVFSL